MRWTDPRRFVSAIASLTAADGSSAADVRRVAPDPAGKISFAHSAGPNPANTVRYTGEISGRSGTVTFRTSGGPCRGTAALTRDGGDLAVTR